MDANNRWNSAEAPVEGAVVYVLAADRKGRYEIPFPVRFEDERWWNAGTGQELDAFVVGWRPLE